MLMTLLGSHQNCQHQSLHIVPNQNDLVSVVVVDYYYYYFPLISVMLLLLQLDPIFLLFLLATGYHSTTLMADVTMVVVARLIPC